MDSNGSCKSDLGHGWTPLGREIAARIALDGPLRFAEFMEFALYHPELGYYSSARQRWGRDGDYLTTPQVHPAVGRSIAALAAEIDRALDAPEPFTLAEFGSGDGRLMRTVTETIAARSPELYRRLRVVLVERGEASRGALASVGVEAPEGVVIAASADEPAVPGQWHGLVFSNELLDALPVERVRQHDGRLRQSRIGLADGALVERFDLEPTEPVRRYLRNNEIELPTGHEAEVCPAVADWFDAVAGKLAAGSILTIDYGHETASLYGPSRPRGTLVCQRRLALDDDPLAHVGEKDITAHVDFGNLRRLGRRHGFEDGELTTLRVLLLGFGAAAEQPSGRAERIALRHLLVSEVGDRHRALLQSRGLAPGGVAFGRERLAADPAESPEPPC